MRITLFGILVFALAYWLGSQNMLQRVVGAVTGGAA